MGDLTLEFADASGELSDACDELTADVSLDAAGQAADPAGGLVRMCRRSSAVGGIDAA